VRNEITEFGSNPTTFESLITGLNVTGLVPQNPDRLLVLLFLRFTHCGVCFVLSDS
jgi:hypothetical protein